MAETTQAQAPVEKGTDEASIIRRMAAIVDDNPADDQPEPDTKPRTQPTAAEAPQQPEQAEPVPAETQPKDPSELTADDLPDDAVPAPATGETFEFIHDGKPVKVTRDQAIPLMRQGYDYTQKTQEVAEKSRSVDAALQRATEIEQLLPALANEQALFVAAHQAIEQWNKVDWPRLAREVSPQDYNAYRAEYEQLQRSASQAAQQLSQTAQSVKAKRQEANQLHLRSEFQKLQELVPEWRDATRYETEAKELRDYLVSKGADPQQVATISDALSVSIGRKAMMYDKLVASKASKSKLLQQAPPVTRPGVPNSPQLAETDKDRQLSNRLKKSGRLEDAVALYASRLK